VQPKKPKDDFDSVINAPARTWFDVWAKLEYIKKWYGTVGDIDLR
jgi:hypothetical protein